MRSYAAFSPTFWTRGDGKALRGKKDAQILAAYLMTAPASNMLGLYHIAIPTIAHETGLTPDEVRAAVPQISKIAQYDETAELAWLPNALRWQTGNHDLSPKDKNLKSLRRQLAEAGAHSFAREAADRYPLLSKALDPNAPPEGLPQNAEGASEFSESPPVLSCSCPDSAPDPVLAEPDADEQPIQSRSKPKQPKVSLPTDWEPNETAQQKARDRGIVGEQLERELAKFRRHFCDIKPARRTLRGWHSSWLNWLDNVRPDRQQRAGINAQPNTGDGRRYLD